MVSQWRTLGWRAGPGPRMWSPGAPSMLLADGARIGWLARDGLFVDQGDHVAFLAMPATARLSVSPSCWTTVVPEDAGVRLSWGAPGKPWSHRVLPPGRVVAGGGWVRWRRGSRFSLSTLDGTPVDAPMGAFGALPWPDGPGASWWEGRYLYRMAVPGQVAVAGILPGPITDGRIGPGGAAVLCVGDALYGVVPGGLPVLLEEEAGLDEARLSATEALLHTHDGVGRFSLADGSLLERAEGDCVPVGFAPEPLVYDEAEGTVATMGGDILHAHFLPGAALLQGHALLGPGGGVWDLMAGTCERSSPALSAEQLLPLGRGVLCVHARELIALDHSGTELRRFARPSPGMVLIEGERLLFLERGRTLIADLSGQVLGATTPRQPPPVLPEPTGRWGLTLDAGVAMGEREWQWSQDGMLLSF
ncbi:MAG: hypothetical protein ACI8RZ_003563 [Myxococcota bacterium]|jgi:hypothetical protein